VVATDRAEVVRTMVRVSPAKLAELTETPLLME
jgi:hypothetical protein